MCKNISRRSFIKTTGLLGACALCGTFPRAFAASNLPTKFRIDACTMCQLDCPACPSKGFIKQYNHFGYLKFKDFKKFVDENTVEDIELANNGEIFLNPELIDIIKYAHEKNITLTAFGGVNGNTVSDELAEALVKYQFRDIVFSIDGASQEVYSIYRRGGDFKKVIANIKKINAYKAQYNSPYPAIAWKYIMFGHNLSDIPKARKIAGKLKIGIFCVPNFRPEYSPIKKEDMKIVKKELYKPGGDFSQADTAPSAQTCDQLWNRPLISFDGQLLGCCCNHYGFFKGNAFKQGLTKALNKSDYLYAKKMLIGQAPENKKNPCAKCYIYEYIKKEGKWLEYNV